MKVNREGLLKSLLSLSPGLSNVPGTEQSMCIVFTEDGRAMTFEGKVCASRKSMLGSISGSIKAKPLLDLLNKLSEDVIDVDQDDGKLVIKGKGRGKGFKAGITMEAKITLPVEEVEVADDWRPLDPAFSEAVSIVHSCAGTNENEFVLTCVHIHPEWLEATDRDQIARYPLKTGVDKSMLVQAEHLKKILGSELTEISETKSWVHFRNPSGLTISIRRDLSLYPNLTPFINPEGTMPVTLPGGIGEVLGKAEIFSADNSSGNHVSVSLRKAGMLLEGQGPYGFYKEPIEVSYSGPDMDFIIAPKLLLEITKRANECGMSPKRLFVNGGKFQFAVSTRVPQPVATKTDKTKKTEEGEA